MMKLLFAIIGSLTVTFAAQSDFKNDHIKEMILMIDKKAIIDDVFTSFEENVQSINNLTKKEIEFLESFFTTYVLKKANLKENEHTWSSTNPEEGWESKISGIITNVKNVIRKLPNMTIKNDLQKIFFKLKSFTPKKAEINYIATLPLVILDQTPELSEYRLQDVADAIKKSQPTLKTKELSIDTQVQTAHKESDDQNSQPSTATHTNDALSEISANEEISTIYQTIANEIKVDPNKIKKFSEKIYELLLNSKENVFVVPFGKKYREMFFKNPAQNNEAADKKESELRYFLDPRTLQGAIYQAIIENKLDRNKVIFLFDFHDTIINQANHYAKGAKKNELKQDKMFERTDMLEVLSAIQDANIPYGIISFAGSLKHNLTAKDTAEITNFLNGRTSDAFLDIGLNAQYDWTKLLEKDLLKQKPPFISGNIICLGNNKRLIKQQQIDEHKLDDYAKDCIRNKAMAIKAILDQYYLKHKQYPEFVIMADDAHYVHKRIIASIKHPNTTIQEDEREVDYSRGIDLQVSPEGKPYHTKFILVHYNGIEITEDTTLADIWAPFDENEGSLNVFKNILKQASQTIGNGISRIGDMQLH